MQEGEDGRGNFSGHVPRQDFGLASFCIERRIFLLNICNLSAMVKTWHRDLCSLPTKLLPWPQPHR